MFHFWIYSLQIYLLFSNGLGNRNNQSEKFSVFIVESRARKFDDLKDMAYTLENNIIITSDDDSLNNDSDDVHEDSDDVHNNLSPKKFVSIVAVNIGALLERPFL